MDKKVGIITFQESNNFGAMYQAYGLQTAIEELGYTPEIIDYHCIAKEAQYSNRFSKDRTILQNINVMLSFGIYKQSRIKFDLFREKYLLLSECKYDKRQLNGLNSCYDAFVCGSDQIWNPDSVKDDGTFFLDFVSNVDKKIPYAPSIGITVISEEYRDLWIKYFNNFVTLSVREQSGATVIEQMTGRKAQVVLDPTLLISKKKWESILEPRVYEKPYILLYNLDYTPAMVDFAKRASKETGLPVLLPVRTIRDYKDGFKCYVWSPQEFLSAIYGAEYVITNTYHGMIMSVIFHKKLIMFDKKCSKNATGKRMDDFLNMVNLSHRKSDGSLKILSEDIDYDKVDLRLEEEKKRSLTYLKESIKKAVDE